MYRFSSLLIMLLLMAIVSQKCNESKDSMMATFTSTSPSEQILAPQKKTKPIAYQMVDGLAVAFTDQERMYDIADSTHITTIKGAGIAEKGLKLIKKFNKNLAKEIGWRSIAIVFTERIMLKGLTLSTASYQKIKFRIVSRTAYEKYKKEEAAILRAGQDSIPDYKKLQYKLNRVGKYSLTKNLAEQTLHSQFIFLPIREAYIVSFMDGTEEYLLLIQVKTIGTEL